VREGKEMRINDCDVNPAHVAEDKRLAYGISRRLPKSILEAIEKLEEDVEMRGWLGSIANDFLVMKKAEMEMLGKMGEQERRAFLIERY
jgi:glutamine synthetase